MQRFLAGACDFYLAALCCWTLTLILSRDGTVLVRTFHERSWVEIVQSVHFGLATLVYTWVCWRVRGSRPWPCLVVVTCGLLWMTNRELDGFWERVDLDLIYQTLRLVVPLPGIWLVYKYRHDRKAFLPERELAEALLLVAICVGLYLFSQGIAEVCSELRVARQYRRSLEESCELLGSAFILFSGVWLGMWYFRREKAIDGRIAEGAIS